MRFWRHRALWVLAAVVLSVWVSGGAVRRYFSRRSDVERLEVRRAEVHDRLRLLRVRRHRADEDAFFIETSARRELGLLAPDEIEFRFVDGPS